MSAAPRISVCLCTCERPALLAALLPRLAAQQRDEADALEIIVADNDAARSAQPVVEQFARASAVPVHYVSEPRRNIALARNASVAPARGEYVAFIDDDERPPPDWLATLLRTARAHDGAAVLAPVRPHFETPPPGWLLRGGFCDRAEHPTGHPMPWQECRTGNVLIRRDALMAVADGAGPFRAAFGTGGEDKDLFMRLARAGHRFVWCNEAAVDETVPPERWRRRFLLRRALLRGRNNLGLEGQRGALLARSLVATPVYALALPFTLPLGQHVFMQCCVRLCDHAGRLLAAVGLNPVHTR